MKTVFFAEWEQCDAILMALPHKGTDWEYVLEEAQRQYRRLVEAFTTAGENVMLLVDDVDAAEKLMSGIPAERLTLIKMEYNDTWTRDYGPLTVERGDRRRALDFGFNGWGLKFASDKDNLVNLHLKEKHILDDGAYRNMRGYVLEGGSVESDGHGTVMTTTRCLCSPNRNGGLTKAEVTERLHEYLGAEHVLWLDYGALAGDDTDSHIDTLARLCPGNTIIFTGCRDERDSHFEELLKMRAQLTLFRTKEGEPYNLVELPLPSPVFDEEGNRLPATYANYLVTPRNIFMPVYGNPTLDTLACQSVRIAYPNHNVIPVDCKTLLRQHGSLHCATMQLPGGILSDVWR
ncbi:MAG: agmatine deiminase family protein [Bacteroidales bacterium]|nr:agmatine deiminase family protein [Bacteroidales bacterium]